MDRDGRVAQHGSSAWGVQPTKPVAENRCLDWNGRSSSVCLDSSVGQPRCSGDHSAGQAEARKVISCAERVSADMGLMASGRPDTVVVLVAGGRRPRVVAASLLGFAAFIAK